MKGMMMMAENGPKFWLFAGFDYESWGSSGGMYSYWEAFDSLQAAQAHYVSNRAGDDALIVMVEDNLPGQQWVFDAEQDVFVEDVNLAQIIPPETGL